MKYNLSLQNPYDYSNAPNLFKVQRWVNTTLNGLINNAETTIRIVNEKDMVDLNSQYRNKNSTTNVLSFPSNLPEMVQNELTHKFIGDIIICHEVVCKEAREQQKKLEAHYAHLIIHGILHLLGYDHIKSEDAEIMEPLEINILAKLGYNNPYEPYDDTYCSK